MSPPRPIPAISPVPTTHPRRRVLALAAIAAAVAGLLVVVPASSSGAPVGPSTFKDRDPVGKITKARHVTGGFRIRGWDFDYDARHTALRTFVRIDGARSTAVTANQSRVRMAHDHPAAGPDHGFVLNVPVPQGTHRLCVVARNVGRGEMTKLGCFDKRFDYSPIGAVDTLEAVPGAISVAGWTLDNDARHTPLTVRISVDGVSRSYSANEPRRDVAKEHPQAGPDHGFAATIKASQGSHQVCVTAVNVGPGSDASLKCAQVLVADSPLGSLDSLREFAGKARLRGWAFDPDSPGTALKIRLTVDGTPAPALTADWPRRDVAKDHPDAGPDHGFGDTLALPEGTHRVCAVAVNLGIGSDVALGCRSVTLSFTPQAGVTSLTASRIGAIVSGWATDPDTSDAVTANVNVDGKYVSTVTANATLKSDPSHKGHSLTVDLPLTSGTHRVCLIAVNVGPGDGNSTPACQNITLALAPLGGLLDVARAPGSTNLVLRGWAWDPDSRAPVTVTPQLDGQTLPSFAADALRQDVATRFPQAGTHHGIVHTIVADDGEHHVCLTATNIGGGADASLGCLAINAVHPVVASAPRAVTATATYAGAKVSWTSPASDGGAPPTSYVITARPGGKTVTVAGTARTASVTGLKPRAKYSFAVTAVNVAGTSAAGVSAVITTQYAPPAQRTPAPVSTSRYVRNVSGSSRHERAMMHREGYLDAQANPSGHAYLILLDIGGQDQYNGGVVLSATTTFVTYSDLARDVSAYVRGYHSGQRAGAPVVIAIGTNNDMDVNRSTGGDWATEVVAPVRHAARSYFGMTVAGANDIEPGFRAGYADTNAWLHGYLDATRAPFVFNGSADGCAWTVTNAGCNNGWTMRGLYNLAAGAAPHRMINLPQVYNTTMAQQWKYISLTGLTHGDPRINFGGVLTEWTACDQSRSCGSLTGHSAWSALWQNLQSDSRLAVHSLPYSTDLRIDH